MTNISNMFLAQCCRLETNSRLIHDFIKFLKIIALVYICELATFGDFMSCGSKDIFKNPQSHELLLIMTSQIL